MKLQDFAAFAPFKSLREQMAAERLGYFELFDPRLHLTGEERSALQAGELRASDDELLTLLDNTLAYKNSRVLVYEDCAAPRHYHLTACDALTVLQGPKRLSTASIERFAVGEQNQMQRLSVCPLCLHRLGFNGFDLQRERRKAYSEKLLKDFRVSDYFSRYPQYPVREQDRVAE